MGHAQDDFLHALVAGLFDGQVEQRDQAFGAFERKAFCADEFFANELLESDGIGQAGENAQLFLAADLDAIFGRFHPFLKPATNAEIVDVHELHADGAAVGIAQTLNDVAQGQKALAMHRLAGKTAIHVRFGEAVMRGIEFGGNGAREAEWIDVGDHVTADAVGAH